MKTKNNKNKNNNKNIKLNYLQYSHESINLKVKILYISSFLFKIALLIPFFNIFIINILGRYFKFLAYTNDLFRFIISLVASILVSIIICKKEYSKNPLFLDDKIVVSNRQKSNGSYENIHLSKFTILLGSNIICILPLSGVASLTISSIICFILKLIPSLGFTMSFIKYLLTLIIFKFLSDSFNKTLIVYLRNKKE